MTTTDLDARIAAVASSLARECAPWRRFAYLAFGVASVALVFARPAQVWVLAFAALLNSHHDRRVDELNEHLNDLTRMKQRDGGAS